MTEWGGVGESVFQHAEPERKSSGGVLRPLCQAITWFWKVMTDNQSSEVTMKDQAVGLHKIDPIRLKHTDLTRRYPNFRENSTQSSQTPEKSSQK
ncbi:hypothetical protein A2617_03250 [Candidatus Daviesbacteria bacterium RIFOXYD1_FULL_41_10]|uniref:Uncharacterized protein n=2 Tax=Candidatus Daviesiibacteriota TaxID=1752718 RepID=A0A1F5N0P9_9BACT|nr:MAG: hypothetical protein UU67_C0039G0009 [Candidatus Daviesbacteria bacterium GW2011_GWB1_41_5]OGE71207.1 MAG: hypothetical protein A2617_03250 [Candidatus Daviesbacteria bacterium RIFOXYD1_FULL_41_10]